jgi:hypothetical protein
MAKDIRFNETRSELFDEYYKLAAIVQSYDSYCLTIKAWGVTVSGAAIGVAFSRGGSLGVFIIAFSLSMAFWLTEVRFKLFQLAHMLRISELENALQNNVALTSPRIFSAFGEQSRANLKSKRWKTLIFWPQIMLPHIFFASLSLALIVFEIVRFIYNWRAT